MVCKDVFLDLDYKKTISLVFKVQMTCLRLVSLIDSNLCFGFTGGVLLVPACAFSGAQ